MAKPFKFRYVNEIVGGFVLFVVALLVVAVVLIGHYQQWFTPVHTLHIVFPPEGSLGLKKGSDVEILQNLVGRIDSIDIDESDQMTGKIRIKGDWIRFVRTDSGAATAEYAVVTVAAAGLGGLLIKLLTSDWFLNILKMILEFIIKAALSFFGLG